MVAPSVKENGEPVVPLGVPEIVPVVVLPVVEVLNNAQDGSEPTITPNVGAGEPVTCTWNVSVKA